MNGFIECILVPTDGSEGAQKAVEMGVRMADAFGASILLLRVHDPEIFTPGMYGELPAISAQDLREMTEGQLSDPDKDEGFKVALTIIGERPCERKIVWGHRGGMICQVAEERPVQHIVIGSRGRSAVTQLILGSVSSYVTHHAHCPVTVVR
jgi:nucleotide-binding universal stress UspA family protein